MPAPKPEAVSEAKPKRYASTKEVAYAMGVSQRSVTVWCTDGRFANCRLTPGGMYRIEVDEDGWPLMAEGWRE
jgi:hypothetical protein